MISSRFLVKRADPVPLPSGDGIGSATTILNINTLSSLVVDTAVKISTPQLPPGPAPSLIATSTFTLASITTTSTVTLPSTAPEFTLPPTPEPKLKPALMPTLSTPLSTATVNSDPTLIPISTVVGASVGTLIGVSALITLGLWLYKRYGKLLEQNGRPRRVLGTPRIANGEQGRRRSHRERWSKLEEGGDMREGMYQTKEADNVAPVEKLTVFKESTPSFCTTYITKSFDDITDDTIAPDSHSFAQYHPKTVNSDLPIARKFLDCIDTSSSISWDSDTLGEKSCIESVATKPQSHLWESAEVLQHVEPPAQTSARFTNSQNPFENDHSEQARNTGNPFFSAQGSASVRRSRSNSTRSARSRSGSIQSRSSPVLMMKPEGEEFPIPKVDKTRKGRAIEPDDPFADAKVPALSRPVTSHRTLNSLSSISSDDRALQSLIATLNVSAEEAQERLRIASMQ